MKRVLFIAALAAFILSIPAWGATITVTSPAAGVSWCKSSTYTITWIKSGDMQATAAIRLRTAGSSESDPAALAIADGTANDGSYSWTVPNSIPDGQYFIRVRTDDSTVIGDSGTFTVSTCGGGGASITVTSPGAGAFWCRGNTYPINWTKSGTMQATAAIRLRAAGSSESDPAALAIADGIANNGSFSWTIPDTVPAGRYFIRVRTDDSTVIGDSPIFEVRVCIVGTVLIPTFALPDLELRSIRYNPEDGGHIAGLVFNTTEQRFDQDVTFSYVISARGGLAPTTHRVTLEGHRQAWVNLHALPIESISTAGLRVRVKLDGPNRISESNEENNEQEDRLCQLDLSCIITDKHLSKRYMDIFYYFHIKFTIKVRNNLPLNVYNVPVRWRLIQVSDGDIVHEWKQTIERLDPSGEYSWSVDEKFGKIGREGSRRPRLAEGVAYRAVAEILNPEERFCDTNSRNNSSTTSIEFPD
jgi:hypothetical protein